MQNKKVAIAGLWHRHDYGSILGCYSLYKFIDNSGFSPVLMNKPKDLWGENEKYEDENSVAGKFIYPRCEVLPVFTSEQDYENLNNDCDIFVTGGDNVWDYSLCGSSGQYFYLDFVANNKIKIAYDSGFNGNCIPRDIKESINRYIKGFTAISVSEKESTDFLKREFGVKADAVINSFFLNTRGMYDEIAEYSRYLYNKNQNKFTVVIVQSGSAVINNLIRRTEEKYEIPAIVFHNPDKPEEKSIFSNDGFIVSEYTAVEDYVWAVKNAEYVISDSIQAICLAIIFNKPFVAVTSRFAVDHVCFEELLKKFALGYKIYNTDDYTVNYESILDSQINYNPVNNFIDYTRTLSQNWLINALNKNSFEIENESSGVVNYQHFEKKQVYKQTLYKIQNLIFPDCEWKDKHQEMLYRGVKMIYDPGRKSWNIPVGGVVECFTYFNSLSIKKWIKYTTADKFYLHLKIKGSFKIHFFGHYIETPIDKKGNSIPVEETLNKIKEMDINRTHFIYRAVDNGIIKKEIFEERSFRFDEPNELILPVLYDKASVVGIFLTANSECEIFDGYYSAVCFEQLLNPVDISIVSCTFQKEEYVKQNINILKNEIILSGKQGGCDEIFEHIFVNIVDNGRTLIPEEHEGYRLKIYPNPNAGGAGGFTRGMMETIKRSE